MNTRCFSPDEEENLGHMVFWSFYHWPALMFPCVDPCVSCSRATCIAGQWQTVLGLQLPETPDPSSSVLQSGGLFCLKRKLLTDTDQTHHEHHNHSIQRDSSLCLSTETPQEAEKLRCLLHTDRERTTEGPTPPTAALFPWGLTPQGWDSPVLEETPAATCKPFTSMRVAKLGTRWNMGPCLLTILWKHFLSATEYVFCTSTYGNRSGTGSALSLAHRPSSLFCKVQAQILLTPWH